MFLLRNDEPCAGQLAIADRCRVGFTPLHRKRSPVIASNAWRSCNTSKSDGHELTRRQSLVRGQLRALRAKGMDQCRDYRLRELRGDVLRGDSSLFAQGLTVSRDIQGRSEIATNVLATGRSAFRLREGDGIVAPRYYSDITVPLLDGKRTIGVLTKIDLMDHGTNALEILQGRVYPLKLGFIGVVNRSQQDIQVNKSLDDALQAEKDFFRSHPAYRNMAHRCGTQFLAKSLNTVCAPYRESPNPTCHTC